MRQTVSVQPSKLYKLAFGLAIFTIAYNLAEGVVSMVLGVADESLALFGFGADSFIEVISGLGIAHMVFRMRSQPEVARDRFEDTALRVTGVAFFLLTGALVITSTYNIWTSHAPQTTFWGVVISAISIIVMAALMWAKTAVGKGLNSRAILADAACTKVCIYMSVVLLAASAIYQFAGIPYIDSVGTLGLAFLSFREGRECFEKAQNNDGCCQ